MLLGFKGGGLWHLTACKILKPPLYKLCLTPFPARGISLSHHHLLDLHVVAIDEAEHVDALGSVDVDVGAAVDAFALHDAAVDVDHLQGGVAFVVDDEAAVAVEGEGVVVVVTGGEHEGEAAFAVGGLSIEAVARGGEQVDVVAVHVVDEVEVAEAHFLAAEVEGVVAVLFSFEVDGHFTHSVAIDHSVVLAFDGHVDLGVVFVELELGQHVAFAEADDGAVDHVVAAGEVKDES